MTHEWTLYTSLKKKGTCVGQMYPHIQEGTEGKELKTKKAKKFSGEAEREFKNSLGQRLMRTQRPRNVSDYNKVWVKLMMSVF